MKMMTVAMISIQQALRIRCPQVKIWAALMILLGSSLALSQTRFVDRRTTCVDRTGSEECRGCPKGVPNCVPRGGPFAMIGEGARLNYKDGDGQPIPPGGTLVIRSGIYSEPIVLNKALEIRAEGPVTISPPAILAPFDLVADSVDANGLPLNPKWGAIRNNPGNLPDPAQCPVGRRAVHDGGPDPGSPPCTNQFTYLNKGAGCPPHVNWFGATFEGIACWNGYSDVNSGGILERDKDYNINLRTVDLKTFQDTFTLQTTVSTDIHGEFRGPRTVQNFATRWWKDFEHAVTNDDDETAHRMIDGATTIMTGLVSLDCPHDCNSELHPVWALAMNIEPSRDNDVWELFVGNQGDNGSCIGDIDMELIDFPNNRYTVRLPWRDGATSVEVDLDLHGFKTRSTIFSVHVRKVVGEGVFLTFPLEPPAEGAMWDGEVRLRWTGPNVTVHPRTSCP